jgi:geranylgeranyl diphosphate synthase type I
MRRYAAELDAMMRQVVDSIADAAPGFGVELRYPLGWVDERNQPYHQQTGKRIRPALLLLCTEVAGGDWRCALPAAVAVELLHNFSLIHDDIQDNSPTRHGRPTVWRIWGIANAINAGDALFALACHALERLKETGVPAEVVLQVWEVFNRTALELTRGQHLDMRFERQETVSVDEYVAMISGKSAALIAACAQIGALIATGSETIARLYSQFGLNLGIAFQIHDDILGIWGDPSITGKSAATDILSRKKSLPVLYGLSQSEELRHVYERSPFLENDVRDAVRLLDSLGARDYAQNAEVRYHIKAIDALREAKSTTEAVQWLNQFIDQLLRRAY